MNKPERTPLSFVYEAFLARITADDWTVEEELAIVERDWQQLLNMAIFRFKYPRVSLEYSPLGDADNTCLRGLAFNEALTNDEIQILAALMKHEWIRRCIASWENIKQLYTDKDFSQANHLDKLLKLESTVAEEIDHLVGIYDRSRNKAPADYFRRLAGKKNAIK